MTELAFAKQFLAALDSRPIKLSSDHVVDPRTYPAQSAASPTHPRAPPLHRHTPNKKNRQYILPRLPNQPPKRQRTNPTPATPSTPSASAGATVSPAAASPATATATARLKPLKPTAATPATSLAGLAPTTSAYDVKAAYAARFGLDASRLRLLRDKKPVADSKSLRELVGEEAAGEEVEFSVLVMAGAVLEGKSDGAGAGAAPGTGTAAGEKADVEAPAPVAQGVSGVEVLAGDEFWADLKGFLVQRIRDEGEGERLAALFKGTWEKSVAKP